MQRELDTVAGPGRFVVRSAGTRGWAGSPMDPPAAAELTRLGGDASGFTARDVSRADCEGAELILTATADHRAYVLQEWPQALKRTFTLLEFAHLVSDVEPVRRTAGSPYDVVRSASTARGAATLDDYDLVDPYGQPLEVHRLVADRISAAVRETARGLTGLA